ncbi:MAG: hypothetical protein ACXVQU_08610 [Actinomycetota bacterium]
MSIIERPPPPATAGDPSPSDRLRVITAGRVGHMEARLGTSGFDVVAVAETEEDLLVAVRTDEPDAIVVEADLCDSLEHVRELAPDAVVIVVGDHTPAGAIGRIERGVTGTVMAGLLHALVADGVGAAAVWGLIPAMHPPAAPGHVGGALVCTKVHALGTQVVDLVRDRLATVAAAGAVAAAVSAGIVLSMHAPHVHERAAVGTAAIPIVSPASSPPPSITPSPSRAARTPIHDRSTHDAKPAAQVAPAVQPSAVPTPPVAPPSVTPPPAPHPSPTPPPPSPTTPPPSETPPPPSPTPPPDSPTPPPDSPTPPPDSPTPPPDSPIPPPTAEGTHPPGVANGWDDHKPPKHDDNGNHTGWTNNSVPTDEPPAG